MLQQLTHLAAEPGDEQVYLLQSPLATFARGGLPPRTVRRIREYIDAHVERNLDLESLARLADLSMHHFARAFRTSVGMPPHRYLVERRVARARELLASTNMPLAEIALAAGFSDQSHFARRFREHVGTTPRAYRWNLR